MRWNINITRLPKWLGAILLTVGMAQVLAVAPVAAEPVSTTAPSIRLAEDFGKREVRFAVDNGQHGRIQKAQFSISIYPRHRRRWWRRHRWYGYPPPPYYRYPPPYWW